MSAEWRRPWQVASRAPLDRARAPGLADLAHFGHPAGPPDFGSDPPGVTAALAISRHRPMMALSSGPGRRGLVSSVLQFMRKRKKYLAQAYSV